MQICIYEDDKYVNFESLSFSRPIFDLVCGATTLMEKIQNAFPDHQLSLHCRKYLEEITAQNYSGKKVNKNISDDALLINSRIIAPHNLKNILKFNKGDEKIYMSADEIAAAYLSKNTLDKINIENGEPIILKKFKNIPLEKIDVRIANYIWDLIYKNEEELIRDIKLLAKNNNTKPSSKKFAGAQFINDNQIFISKNVTIHPGVVFDASHGPIYIDENSEISSNAVIEGPVYIGKSSIIKNHSSLKNVSIGNVCKIGGEVEDSVIHSFTNKQHPGFLGHSYLGSWINIGADTNCSDLKNNYSTVKIPVYGKNIDSGKQFLGLIMGDHSKTAINTMFNTGTMAGFSSNIFGAGFPQKYIPSFTWGGSDSVEEYDLSKAMETAKAVFKRRNISFDNTQEKLFKSIFDLTKTHRERSLK